MYSDILAILLLFLFFTAALDLRRRELPLILIAAGFFLGAAMRLLSGDGSIPELLWGCLPGAGMLLFSLLGREAVGAGDGALVVAIGIYLGLFQTLLLLCFSFLLSGLVSVLFLVLKRKGKKEEIAFVPFLLAGYTVLLAVR